jgi:hypothetical protein
MQPKRAPKPAVLYGPAVAQHAGAHVPLLSEALFLPYKNAMKRGRGSHGDHSRLHVPTRLLSGPAPNAPCRQPPQTRPALQPHIRRPVGKDKRVAALAAGPSPRRSCRTGLPQGRPPCCAGAQLSSKGQTTPAVAARLTNISHYVCCLFMCGRQMYNMRAQPRLYKRGSCQGPPALSCVRPPHSGPMQMHCPPPSRLSRPSQVYSSLFTVAPAHQAPHSVCSPGQGLR